MELAIYLIIILFVAIPIYLRKYRRPSSLNSSILLSYYTQDSNVINLSNELLSNDTAHIKLFLQKPSILNYIFSNLHRKRNYFIDIVYLPFTTNIRLLGIPTSSPIKLDPTKGDSLMVPVMLEGDFPNYFNLYSNNNQGTEVRYFMDPTAMAFVVDVCKKYSWEIVNDELIIVSESGVDTEEIKNFISEIQPKIEVPASNLHPNLRGEYKLAFLRKLHCPICKTRTDRMPDNTHKCPQGHGHLVTGSDLVRLAKLKPLDITIAKGKNDHNRNLKCPNCQQIMATIKYKSFNLDTCINCPYRWLDDDEIRQN